MTKSHSYIALLVTVVAFSACISGFYALLVPYSNPTYKTAFVLVAGVAVAAVIGGYIFLQMTAEFSLLFRGVIALVGGVSVGALVLFFSLLVILNTRGA
jgi:hypothetical protein